MNDAASAEAPVEHRSLASALVPVLRKACEGRLGPVTWFKADWQRGGAATGNATYRLDDGREVPVVIKLPVVQREMQWLKRLQVPDDPDPVVPRLYACADTIGGYDLTWVVMERFPEGPLGLHWHEDHIPRIADAAARFHVQAAAFEVNEPPRTEPWADLLAEALDSVKINRLDPERRWTEAIKTLRERLETILEQWERRDVRQWLHGDLHVANAMTRCSMERGSVSLIDLAEVHAGHWIEDAVYLERQLWARPDRTDRHKPVKAIASARKRLGAPVEAGYPRLAMIRRVLLAGTAPRFIRSEGHPRHLEACLSWLELGLNELR